jgi:hypothetical protein
MDREVKKRQAKTLIKEASTDLVQMSLPADVILA